MKGNPMKRTIEELQFAETVRQRSTHLLAVARATARSAFLNGLRQLQEPPPIAYTEEEIRQAAETQEAETLQKKDTLTFMAQWDKEHSAMEFIGAALVELHVFADAISADLKSPVNQK
jgi:isoaspartyl peptidase/L-asparaginase-like protein (Ntn-hydrolase superfamily)